MARDHARVLTAIWADDDFRALPSAAQRLYMLLLTQPDLTYAGALDLRVNRWAACSADTAPDDVRASLEVLAKAGFVVVDEGTEELLVRSYLRVNEVWKQPKLLTLALRQAVTVQSRRLRHALRVELLRLPDDRRADPAREVARTLPDTPADTPPSTPAGTLPDTPKGTPDRTPTGTPTRTRGRPRNQEPGTRNQEPEPLSVETSEGSDTQVDARAGDAPSPDEPPLCRRHVGWPREDIPACPFCQRLREQWQHDQDQADKPPPRPKWCGSCDPTTRLVEIDDRTTARCPDCHPLHALAGALP